MVRGVFFESIEQGVVLKTVFSHIGHKHGGLSGNQKKLFEQRQFFFAEVDGANGLCIVQCGLAFLQNRYQFGRFFVARACGFSDAVQRLFNSRQIGEAQLGLDDFDI